MINQVDGLENHVLSITVEGKLRADELQDHIDAFNEQLASHNQISMFIEILDWEGISFEALIKDIRYGITHVQVLTQLNSIAVVTDENWLKTLAQWENKIFPGMTIRSFALDDRDEAIVWINDNSHTLGPALNDIPVDPPVEQGHTPIKAYRVDGPITKEDIQRLNKELQPLDEVNLMLHMKNFQAPRPNFLGSDWAQMKLRALGQVKKYAVIEPPPWMDAIISFFDPILKMEVRTFREGQLDDAWKWLRD